MTLTQFFKSKLRNSWVTYGHLNLYVRRHLLLHNKKMIIVLALANMNSTKPGSGDYHKLLTVLDKDLPSEFAGIYVENILNERLLALHTRQKWSILNGDTIPCALLLKNE